MGQYCFVNPMACNLLFDEADARRYAYDVTVLTDCCSAKSEEVVMS